MDLSKLSSGKNVPQEVNVVIEIPQGSYIKYEMDKDSGFIVVDRFAYTAMAYPFNYGFIPGTLAADGDPTDVLVISSYPVNPGCVIPARPVGMLEMEDEAGIDTKILAVPTAKVDAFYANAAEIEDLGSAVLNKIRHFFEHYKELEPGKWVKLKGFLPKEKAFEDITNSIQKQS